MLPEFTRYSRETCGKPQRQQRHQVKQQDTQLVNGYPPGMDGIKRFGCQLEPAGVHPIQPAVGEDESAEPDKQNHIVDLRAPQQDIPDLLMAMASSLQLVIYA